MRAVFVRRRTENKATPAWMGGLNYEDHDVPKLPWNMDRRALSSDFASALQTRVHTSVSDFWDLGEKPHTHRASLQKQVDNPGRTRLQSARPSRRTRSPATLASGQGRRPQTAGASAQRRSIMASSSPHAMLERQQLDTNVREVVSLRPATGAGSVSGRRPGSSSTTRSAKEKRLQAHRFYTLHINVVGLSGIQEEGMPVDAEAGFYNACVALAVDGTSDGAAQTIVSKPFKFNQIAYVPLPEDWVRFELTGNVHRMLLSVKMLRKMSESSKTGEAGAQTYTVGSCLLDVGALLTSQLQRGVNAGPQIEVCKLTHGGMGKNSLEVHLDVRMQPRKADFEYEWIKGMLIFKKAGYTITTEGIEAPQIFVARKDHNRRVTKRPNLSMQELQVTEVLEDTQPVVVWKACRADEEGNKTREFYTLKRFPVMEADPRRQLVAELDGLLEMPAHLGVQPVDAFMDRLDAVLVLDNEGGRYLSEGVSKKGLMPERLVSIVVRQVLAALLFLHTEKMRVHNNITASNILVLRMGEVKIGGFSFSTKAFMGHTSCKFAGNFVHMAPERLLGLECGFKGDVWSVGILTLELLMGCSPYDMSRFTGPTAIFDFKKAVVQEPSPSLRRGGEKDEDSRLFVDSCLNKNLKLRAECKGLMVQQFITKYEALTPNYLARWLNGAGTRRSAVNTSVGDEGSPTRRDGDSPTGNMSPTSPQFLSAK